jgi:hypothetical protein
MAKRTTARDIVARITENVDALYARRIDHEEFSRRNHAAWAKVNDRPRLHARVLDVLRERTRVSA